MDNDDELETSHDNHEETMYYWKYMVNYVLS